MKLVYIRFTLQLLAELVIQMDNAIAAFLWIQ